LSNFNNFKLFLENYSKKDDKNPNIIISKIGQTQFNTLNIQNKFKDIIFFLTCINNYINSIPKNENNENNNNNPESKLFINMFKERPKKINIRDINIQINDIYTKFISNYIYYIKIH
jgi:hypothetical protein